MRCAAADLLPVISGVTPTSPRVLSMAFSPSGSVPSSVATPDGRIESHISEWHPVAENEMLLNNDLASGSRAVVSPDAHEFLNHAACRGIGRSTPLYKFYFSATLHPWASKPANGDNGYLPTIRSFLSSRKKPVRSLLRLIGCVFGQSVRLGVIGRAQEWGTRIGATRTKSQRVAGPGKSGDWQTVRDLIPLTAHA